MSTGTLVIRGVHGGTLKVVHSLGLAIEGGMPARSVALDSIVRANIELKRDFERDGVRFHFEEELVELRFGHAVVTVKYGDLFFGAGCL